ncbi:SusC/RagA family TonB-linked outer membrane protein [Chitinophaga rhizosphaerae]|uniref:SusC/RagA family TonB-linked outer membrane protein n=1 Tax=Chitinophaga rhizosphaerae TaxID=1864947 RepID=UPI0013DEF023|nr:SusC/RagA family TonB-linked outer membrane protein [Chitinophaga rhizosphaerae]
MKQVLALWLAMMACIPAIAQDRSISGRVTDVLGGSPLPGVTITIKGTSRGTVTNSSGEYQLKAPANGTLVFSFVGYSTREVAIGNQSTINISLGTDEKQLGEYVVSGYGTTQRSKYTGSVASVSGEKLKDVPAATFDQMLQGRVAGLYSTSGSGQPGTANRVVIRGPGSISGTTAPLYIIDGIALEGGEFATLNAADFETVNVYKDATATALYGSRGANGVIVITTRRGKAGKLRLGAKTQYGWSQRTRPKFDIMNIDQRLQFEEEEEFGVGWEFSPKNDASSEPDKTKRAQILDSLRNINTDWSRIFLRDHAKFQEHEVNLSGGNENIRFYTSLNYFNQEGIALRSGLTRYSFRSNVDFKGDRFSGAVNAAVGYSEISGIENENSSSVVNTFAAAYYGLPYEAPYINGVLVHSGNASQFGGVYDLREGSDALERTLNTTNQTNKLKGTLNMNLRYDLLKNLYARTTMGVDYRQHDLSRYINPNSYTGSQATGRQGSYQQGFDKYWQFTGNYGLTFHENKDKHDYEASLIYEFIRTKSSNSTMTGYGINGLFPETPAGITPGNTTNGFIPVLGGGKFGTALASFIFMGRYSYDDRYTLNLAFRRDGSSTVPEKNRWHNFWSVGGGWNVLKEDFMFDATEKLDVLRLRASYGVSATPFAFNSTGAFGYMATYSPTRYAGAAGVVPATIGNPEYDWEYSKQLNIGFDVSAFRKRVNLSFDWYNRVTDNLFVDEQLSRTTGFTVRRINAGSVRNRGIDVDLSGDILRTRNFTLYAGANFNYNKNEVTNLGAVNEFEQGTSIIRVGLPLGSHYIVKWAGVDPETGRSQYYDREGKIVPNAQYNSSTMSVAEFGTFNPPFTGGFHLGARWKGLTVEALFSFAQGFKRFNNEDFFNVNPSFATSNQGTDWLRRWRKPGDITDIPSTSDPRRFNSKDIQDASYLRFRNLNMSYDLPASLLERTRVFSKVQVYVQAQNILTITSWKGFDPEDNNNISLFEYPAARTFTAGLRLNF